MDKLYFDMTGTPDSYNQNGKIITEGLAGKKVVILGKSYGFSFSDEIDKLLTEDEEITHIEIYELGFMNLFFCNFSKDEKVNIGVIRIRPQEK